MPTSPAKATSPSEPAPKAPRKAPEPAGAAKVAAEGKDALGEPKAAPASPEAIQQVRFVDVGSLTDIVEAHKDSPAKPDPIDLEWYLPPSKKAPGGTVMKLHIETRFPEDQWKFGIEYMTRIQTQVRSQEPDETGKMVRKHKFADMAAMAREVVVSPVWLHNESVYTKLEESMPSPTFASLRRKLMLAAGLNGDFFDEYPALTMPTGLLRSVSESQNASDSTPTLSETPQPESSSPGPSTTTDAAKSPEASVSPTTSG